MLSEQTRQSIFEEIANVYETRRQIPPLTTTYPLIRIEDAYAIQQRFIDQKLSTGARVTGYKVGLTSKAMQQLAGATEPDFSAMLDYMHIAEASEIRTSDCFDPMVEIEIAFVMKKALRGPNVTAVDVIRATDFVLPAIEMVEFRINRSQGLSFIDTVADLAAIGGVIVGSNPRRLDQIDVRDISGELVRNGDVIEKGLSSAVLGSPVTSVAWLANKLSAFGVGFEPGELVLSGSFVRAAPVKPGDKIVARFSGGLGDVAVDFV
ncbi:2-keto-4-pentenoate hydratase [Bradyrhizobium septentrionale]|uniref:Fumarylacetoacetate hydrolase family protein n=1 Tax=Bradyrhizobium septentrionale TaxID=1404411 RepID=A0A974A4C3_9BRAD|nr:fumarylacetoacetate hydrolase family protein [Bradyrhizobium septentrionale]UGY16261.1 fumarylacetoacetate hydrolase family protein [Bradyrhizobium septentrionale]UGY24894.1 fumarylacetoacetate hydrolase family protein [Bradyrhizobium septentrionale]